MRPTARLVISFGLVTVPVAVYPARVPTAATSFTRLHTVDGGRVRNEPVCSAEGRVVPPGEIGRGFRTEAGIVPLSDRDLDALPLPTAKTFTLAAFLAADDIDPHRIGTGYYLGAEGPAATKPYVLLRDTMARHRRVGVGKVALHANGRETLAMLRPLGHVLVLQQLLWTHQVRSEGDVLPRRRVRVAADELEAAETLMDTFGPLTADDVRDDYREQLDELARAKLAAREPHFDAAQLVPSGPVVDLMTALRESVKRAEAARGEEAAAPEPAMDRSRPAAGRSPKTARSTSPPSGKKTRARRRQPG